MIYVSWLHHEKSYLVEQSPIMLAMMESAERSAAELERKEKEASRLLGVRKSQKKQIKQTPGTFSNPVLNSPSKIPSNSAINNVLNRPLSNPTAGPPPPSASDYVPPVSFLQNISNPQNQVIYPK